MENMLRQKDVTKAYFDNFFLEQATKIVERNINNKEFNAEVLNREMGCSKSRLYSKLKQITGLSSSEFIRSIRLKRAVQLFEQEDLFIKEIMYMTGFNTPSYFAKCFKKEYGVRPSEYQKYIHTKSSEPN